MRRLLWCLLGALVVCVEVRTASAEGAKPPAKPPLAPIYRYASDFSGRLVSGGWTYDFRRSGGGEVEGVTGVITGFSLAPGRSEIAYCTGAEEKRPSQLWVVEVLPEEVLKPHLPIDVAPPQEHHVNAPPKLVWSAPAGVSLHAPPWWSPDGSKVAVLGGDDLYIVDLLAGKAERITQAVKVIDVAWHPQTQQLAYVTESEGKRQVWLRAENESKRVGEGGLNLRWSPDGVLSWYAPRAAGSWAAMRWEKGRAAEVGSVPARNGEAMWSPNGQLCAALEGTEDKHLVIYPTHSSRGETIPLPDAHLQRLLGWTPDSNLVMVLVDLDMVLFVAARPPEESLAQHEGYAAKPDQNGRVDQPVYAKERAYLFMIHMDPAVGPPVWSPECDYIAAVMARRVPAGSMWLREDLIGGAPLGKLLTGPVKRRYEADTADEQAVKEKVWLNMFGVGIGLRHYLQGHDNIFPTTSSISEIEALFKPAYAGDPRRFFLRPDTGETCVQYVLAPGTALKDIADPAKTVVFETVGFKSFKVVVYANGEADLQDDVPRFKMHIDGREGGDEQK